MPIALVTGANGFIGSHLCELLLTRGYEVAGLVRPTSDVRACAPLSARFGPRFRLVLGDVTRSESLPQAVAGVDYVFHLAATVMGTSEREFAETNAGGTEHLLRALRQRGGGLARFLLASSQAAAGPSPSATPIDETRPPAPVSWYGRSKEAAERAALAAQREGLPVTIIRPVAVYGEREQDLSGGTFPAVQLGLKPHIGLGEKTVTMVYVGDLVRGIVAAAESPAALGRIYFLADPAPIRASELVRGVADAMAKRVRIPVFVPHAALAVVAVFAEASHYFTRARPMLTRDKVREMRQRHWAASADAARRDFQWQPEVPLAEGLVKAVADWRARQRVSGDLTNQPDRERVIQTYTLAVVAGILNEGVSDLAKLYHFDPAWFIVVAVLGLFGLGLGTVAYLTARAARLVQFLVGAASFIVVEQVNHFWLGLWHFAPEPFGTLDPWVRAGILAVPIGLVPVVINAVVGAIYRLRLRIG